MRRVLLLAAAVLALGAGRAHATVLHAPLGQHAIRAYLKFEYDDGYNTGYRVLRCRRWDARRISCQTTQFGVTVEGDDGIWTVPDKVTAIHRGGNILVTTLLFGPVAIYDLDPGARFSRR